MRKLFLLFIFAVVGCTAFGQAQATANFTASVTIIEPIGITTTSNMNFAKLDAKSGGAVVLSPDNTRISLGGVELKESTGVSAASFELTGEPGFSFSLSLPQNEYLLSNGAESIIIKDFTSSLAASDNLQSRSQTFRLGATLEIKPGQAPGLYTTQAPLSVTVNYN